MYRILLVLLALVAARGRLEAQENHEGSRRTFAILYTNDCHSHLLGFGPNSEYTPLSINDDGTRGGVARRATLIQQRRAALAADKNARSLTFVLLQGP